MKREYLKFLVCPETKEPLNLIDEKLILKYAAENHLYKDSLFSDIADNLDPGTLILTETTIPPGASRKILFPILRKKLILSFCLLYSFNRCDF